MDMWKRLHDWGFALHWLHPKSKRPIGNNWQNAKRPNWDKFMSTYEPGNNIGVRPGAASRLKDNTYLVIFDCDVKSSKPEHLIEMEKHLKVYIPDIDFCPFVNSGRRNGSRHYYARTKMPMNSIRLAQSAHQSKVLMPSVKASSRDADKLTKQELEDGWRMRAAWEIDLYGSGKQAVIPDSIHPDTGLSYEWDTIPKDLKELPLIEIANKKARLGKSVSAPVKFVPVDLLDFNLSDKIFKLVAVMEGMEDYDHDRSRALNAAIYGMVKADLDNNEIVSALTDEDNALSECALDRGKGSRARAARWVLPQVNKARENLKASHDFLDQAILDETLNEDEARAQEIEMLDWRDSLDKNQQGGLKNSLKNVETILRRCTKDPLIGFEQFSNNRIYLLNPPWVQEGEMWKGKELVDSDFIAIKVWINRIFKFEPSIQTVIEAVMHVSMLKKYHVVRDWLNTLQWDGRERLDYWLLEFLNAEGPEDYIKAVSRKTLVAAVKRVFEPGCKFDYMTVLEGNQGIGKSTALAVLAGEWFSDSIGDIENKDVINQIQSKWIIEVGEMAAANRSEVNSLKLFTSRQVDRARVAFARTAENYPRQCIFIGTTNNDTYLKDETGNRRFWPVRVGDVYLESLRAHREQIWAEAVHRYKAGEKLWLDDKKLEIIAKQEQNLRFMVDEWETVIGDWLDCDEFKKMRKSCTANDIWSKCFGHDVSKFSKADQMRVGQALTRLQWKRARRWKDGKVQRLWERPQKVDETT